MGNRNIKFSVVIPAYNAAAFIADTLDSVRQQSYPPFEVLVTNDGSTDDTAAVIASYAARYPEFSLQLASQPNKGIGGARNNGILRASGDFIAFLDADDRWYPDKLEQMARFFGAHPEADVVCHYEQEIAGDGVRRNLTYASISGDPYDCLLFEGNRLSPSATVVRLTTVRAIEGFSERLDFNSAEDYEFWLRLARLGASFAHCPLVLGEYHRVVGCVTSRILYHHANVSNVIKYHFDIMERDGRYPKSILHNKRNIRLTQNIFSVGRAFYLSGDLLTARIYYCKSLMRRPFWWKSYAGLLQCYLKAVAMSRCFSFLKKGRVNKA
jgi:glycosyltransferase involved in cell wall biosynthesis